MASRSKNGHESSQSSDSTSPVAASTASWLFHRMISTEFSKGEDEWEMQLRKSRRKKRRESKSDVSSKDNDDRPGEEESETCSDMDTSSDEFFSATEELLSSAEDEDEDVDGLSDSVSFQCRVSVPLPEPSERGRNRRQKKKHRRQRQDQLAATLQTLPLDDSLGKVTVPKEYPSYQLSIDISEDAVLAAQGVTPSTTLCIEVPTLVELCLRRIWKNTPKSIVLPSKEQKVPSRQKLPYQMRVQAGLIALERERRQFSLQWLLTALQETEKRRFESIPAEWSTTLCSLPVHDFITPIALCKELRSGRRMTMDKLLATVDPGWVYFSFTTASCGWKAETPSSFPNEQTRGKDMHTCGGTVMKRYVEQGGWFISGLARLIGLFLPDNSPASHLTQMDGSLAPLACRVKSELCQRFPAMCRVGFDVALAYVLWSRGFVDATVSAFLKLSKNTLDGAMKSFYLNEIGRLYWHLRDCATAGRFFRLAAESVPAEGTALVLIASMCDSGLLGPSSGRQAHRAWSAALSSLHSYHDRRDRVAMPSPVFVNAVESMVFCHAGKSFLIDPASRNRESVDSWLASVVEWIRPLVIRHPWLSYHSSVLLSLLTIREQSALAFTDFAAFTTVDAWIDNNHPISESPSSFLGSCWSQLEEIVKSAQRSHGYLPLLQIRWRTMLKYPCLSGNQAQRFRLAEQHGSPLNIRLHDTSHITANVMMELPYYQPVFSMLDGSITHQLSADSVDPWMVDSLPYAEKCTTSASISRDCILLLDDSNGHRVVCHRYTTPWASEVVVLELSGVDGCRKRPVRLKLERAVREARYKQVSEMIDAQMERGQAERAHKGLKKAMSKAVFPSSNIVDLLLPVSSGRFASDDSFRIVAITIFGKATICFHLDGSAIGVRDNYLAVVDARSVDRFLSPRIYFSFPKFRCMEYAFRHPTSEKFQVKVVSIVRFLSTSHLLMHMKSGQRSCHRFAVLTEDGQLSYHPYPLCDCIFENSEFEYSAQYDHYAVVVEKRQPHRYITWLARKFDLTNMKPLNVCELAVEGGVGVTCHPLRPVAGVLFISCPSGVFAVDMVSMKTPDEVADQDAAVALLIADQCHKSQDAGTGTDASAVDGSQHGVATSGAAGVDHVTEDDGADEVAISDITFDDMATYPVLSVFFPGRFQLTKIIGHSPETMVMHEGVAIGKSCDLVLATDYHIRWLRLYRGLRGTTAICQLFTTQLASWPVEACFLPAEKGLLVTSTVFLKSRTDGGFCREQLYWFSEQGELLGFLPFLGAGPHDFYPVLREKVHGSDDANDGQHVEGLFVYFSDGHGAMACIQLE